MITGRDGVIIIGSITGGFVFGMVLIASGILLLLNTFNIISWKVWDEIWRFWPLIIILWGLQIISGMGFLSRVIINLLGLIGIVLITLFAIHQVKPSLLSGLPPVFNQIFSIMKGVQK